MRKIALLLALASVMAGASASDIRMFDSNAPGCVVTGPDGKPLSLAGKPGDIIRVPRGTVFSPACFIDMTQAAIAADNEHHRAEQLSKFRAQQADVLRAHGGY
jgi:hypothetical protein